MEERNMEERNMEKQVLIQELQKLESGIRIDERDAEYECSADEDDYWRIRTAKISRQDAEMLKHMYKIKTIDLSVEDRKELAQMAADKNIKLEMLFELMFTEEEKEDYLEFQAFLNTSSPEDAELDRLLDEEMKKKEIKMEEMKKKGIKMKKKGIKMKKNKRSSD